MEPAVVPFDSTIQPMLGVTNSTSWTFVVAPAATVVHVEPPFVVFRTVAVLPTAHPFCVSKKWTESRLVAVGAVCVVHVDPPSAVTRIVRLHRRRYRRPMRGLHRPR